MRIAVTTHGERIWRALRRTPKVNSAVNRRLINGAVYTMRTLPGALSTMGDYTSWESLRDRTWSRRHLRADPGLVRDGKRPVEQVTGLFARPAGHLHPRPRPEQLYGQTKFFPGLFAEDIRPGATLPPLMATMVAVDAFPRLSPIRCWIPTCSPRKHFPGRSGSHRRHRRPGRRRTANVAGEAVDPLVSLGL